jgi:hypothetical protein
MLYAHWEGHVRFCANKYFEHLTLKKLRFEELEVQLYVNRFLIRLDPARSNRGSFKIRSDLVTEILSSSRDRFSRINPSLVDTGSNLSTEVMKDLCLVCAVDSSFFEENRYFIDVILLRRRNSIAHGEEVFIEESEVDDLVATGIGLMRAFKDLLQNKVYTKAYLAA